MLKFNVESTRCQGHGRCAAVAPDLFRLDEIGYSHPAGDGSVSAGLADRLRLAAANCPEGAIRILKE
jgi:ferredoxin